MRKNYHYPGGGVCFVAHRLTAQFIPPGRPYCEFQNRRRHDASLDTGGVVARSAPRIRRNSCRFILFTE